MYEATEESSNCLVSENQNDKDLTMISDGGAFPPSSASVVREIKLMSY